MGDGTGIWFFENTDLFKIFCPRRQEALAGQHELKVFSKDNFVYFSDEPSNHIYLIAQGRIKIGCYSTDGKENIKTVLGRGEIFGELALAGEDTRQDFAQAMDNDTHVCLLRLSDMEELMKNDQDLCFKITKLIGFRLRKAERKIESLVFKDAQTRIIEYLRDLGIEKGAKGRI